MQNVIRIDGKVALVTGASSGLGAHIARVLAAAGVTVALAARREDRLVDLCREIGDAGGVAEAVTMDVRDVASVEAGVARASERLGPIDILINNAGVTVVSKAENFSHDDFLLVMETNLFGPWYCAQAVGKRMIARGKGGKIVNIASMLGMRTFSQLAPYCSSKAGLARMTECLALEWSRHNIQVNAVSPGYIETEMNAEFWRTKAGEALIARFPNRRLAPESALDAVILTLCSSHGDHITGIELPVDDGQRFM